MFFESWNMSTVGHLANVWSDKKQILLLDTSEDVREKWETFVSGALAEAIKQNTVELVSIALFIDLQINVYQISAMYTTVEPVLWLAKCIYTWVNIVQKYHVLKYLWNLCACRLVVKYSQVVRMTTLTSGTFPTLKTLQCSRYASYFIVFE